MPASGAVERLLVLRHAKTVTTSAPVPDRQRTLTERGMTDAFTIGAWAKDAGQVPDVVVASTAARARQTAEIACHAMDLDPGEVAWMDDVYGARVPDLLAILGGRREAAVMLVGHNPGCEDLVDHLAEEASWHKVSPDGRLPTAGCVVLDVSGGLRAGACPVLAFQAPRAWR